MRIDATFQECDEKLGGTMFKLAYISRADPFLTDEQVAAMVERSQTKNERLGITGFLCLRDDTFLQYLEGEEQVVRELMDEINRDPRHQVLQILELGHQPGRNFGDWQMRYLDKSYMGQVAMEDRLQLVIKELVRGHLGEAEAQDLADRLIGRIAEVAR